VAQLAKARFSEGLDPIRLESNRLESNRTLHAPKGNITHTSSLPLHETRECMKQAVARLRLSSGLPIQANLNHSTPYEERICIRCGGGVDN
jgi:hypothetical protein